jgi:hypothetical protein
MSEVERPWDTSIATSIECPHCRCLVYIEQVNGEGWAADDGLHRLQGMADTEELTDAGTKITVCHDPVVVACDAHKPVLD